MKKKQLKSIPSILILCSEIYQTNPLQCVLVVALMGVKILTSSFGLLMILPMLQLVGIPILSSNNSQTTDVFTRFLSIIPIQFNMSGILCVFVTIQVLISILHFLQEHLQLHLKEVYLHHKETELYTLLIHCKWEYLHSLSKSSIFQNMFKDIEHVDTAYYLIMQLLNQIILITTCMALSFIISYQLTFIACLAGFFCLMVLLPIMRRVSHSGRRYLALQKNLMESFYEQLTAIKLIKSRNYEKHFLDKMRQTSQARMREHHYFSLLHAFSKCSTHITSTLVLCLIILTAIQYLALSAGLLLFQLLVFAKMMPLMLQANQTFLRLLHVVPALKSLQELKRTSLSQQDETSACKAKPVFFNHKIDCINMSFQYATNQSSPVFTHLNCRFYKNKLTVISGNSGIGKSTLSDLLMGLLKPKNGQILVDDLKLTTNHWHAWRQKIAYLPQHVVLFNTSLRNNLTLLCPKTPTEQDIWMALKLAHADDFVASFENQLDTIVGDRGEYLSGGQRQRIALARALLLKPEILILDEPTNSLDYQSRVVIKTLLGQLKHNMTIIIITHDEALFDMADFVIDLNHQTSHQPLHTNINHDEMIEA